MEILVKQTNELNQFEWGAYVNSFNEVFNKNFNQSEFEYKYYNTIDKTSYHSLLIENDLVIGAFTIIPYEYIINGIKTKIGLAVDVYVKIKYRKNPLLILKMYNKLKTAIIEQRISITIGVPNDKAYNYWKKVLKWKDIGLIPYYMLPVKSGNIYKGSRILLNGLNFLFLKVWMSIRPLTNRNDRYIPIHINRENEIIERQRYTKLHKRVSFVDFFFSYRIVNEEGILTCYIIDFYQINGKEKNRTVLKKAINYILKNEDIDLILYVGNLGFKLKYLIRVPYKKEPKHLFLTGDILNLDGFQEKMIFKIINWEFGLFNYDVR